MKYLIKNAIIIQQGHSLHRKKRDILVVDGIIKEIGVSISAPKGSTSVEGKQLHVCLGLFDIGTHSGEPGYEHRETINSLTQAARVGGYTGLAIFPTTKPVLQTKSDIQYLINHPHRNGVKIYPIGVLSKDGKGIDIAEYFDMFQAGAIAFGDGLHSIPDNGLMSRALQYADQLKAPVIHHPSDSSLSASGEMHEGFTSTTLGMKGIPDIAEILPIHRDILVAQYTQGQIIEHCISSGASVALIAQAKKSKTNIASTVGYLNLIHTDEDLSDFDTNLKLIPVLRSKVDRKALIKGVNDGTISAIVTNHTPLDEESKNLEFTYADDGAIGLETCLVALIDQVGKDIELDILIDRLTVGPRQILNIPIPTIEVGSRAELCIFDLGQSTHVTKETILSKSKNSPYIGKSFGAKVIAVIG